MRSPTKDNPPKVNFISFSLLLFFFPFLEKLAR